MNKWKKLIKQNWLASIIASAILVTCLALLYYKHPASPYFKYDVYVLRYEQIGTLSPGNRVQVNGLTRGQIQSVELTEDAVFVTIQVAKGTKIQKNSKFNLINAGLMGEREVAILLGDSEEFLADGDTARGNYDEGTSGLSQKIEIILTDLDSILDKTKASIDAYIGENTMKRLNRVKSKAGKAASEASGFITSNVNEAKSQIDNLDAALEKAKSTLSNVGDKGDKAVANAQNMIQRVDATLAEVKNVKVKFDEIGKKVDATVEDYDDVAKALDKLSKSVDAFSADLKKDGLKVNIDFF